MMYIKDTLKTEACDGEMDEGFHEAIWCKLKLRERDMIIGTCYRSPNSDADNKKKLLAMLEQVTQKAKGSRLMILGDFNCPRIDYKLEEAKAGEDTLGYRLFEKTQDLLLVENVKQNTHFRVNNESSKLDYIFTEEENVVEDILIREPLGKSDHAVITWTVQVEQEEFLESRERKLNYWKADYDRIKQSWEQRIGTRTSWESPWRNAGWN